MKELLRRIRQILKDRRVRRFFTRVVSTVAAIVVFVTTYALILPAITMEATASCGIPAHQHTDDCYTSELVCEIPESDGHKHTDDCYSIELVLTCEETEHTHSVENGCYDEDGNLICETPEHQHDADNGCYTEQKTLTCEIEESEGHHHDSSCYKDVLTCGLEAHTHSASCYSNSSTGSTGEGSESAAVASTESAAIGASTGAAIIDEHSVDNDESGSTSYTGDGTEVVNGDSGTTGVSATGSTTVEYDFTEESAAAATTNVMPEEVATEDLSEGYVPQLDAVDMDTVIDKHTGFYYYHPADGEELPTNSAEIEDWQEYEEGTELENSDLLRLYLSYTVPAGTLNETNQVSRYRLPSNIRLTDEQIIAINETVNGVAAGYKNYDTLEILDPDKYEFYKGAEAIEGTRTPDQKVNEYLYDLVKAGKEGQEYISAVVKAENIVNEHTGEVEAQDLIFIWTPYSIEKNQHEYDKDGQPTKAGEKITGWFSVDFNTAQVEWVDSDIFTEEEIVENADAVDTTADEETGEDGEAGESGGTESGVKVVTTTVEKTADVVFVEKDKDTGTKEISQTLKLVEKTVEEQPVEEAVEETETAEQSSTGETAEAAEEADTADAATTGETAEDANAATTAATEAPAEAATADASTGETAEPVTTDEDTVEYQDGTLTADGDGYKITLDYTAEAEIPDNAYLSVREITAETDKEAYEACLETAKAQVESTDDTTVQKVDTAATRFFDIEILAEETVKSDKADKDDETSDAASNEGTTVDGSNAAVEETVTDVDDTATVDIDNTDEAETASDDVTEAIAENTEYGQNASDAAVEDTNEASDAEKADEEAAATTTIRKIEPAAPVSVRIELMDAAVERTDAEEAASSEQKNDLQKNDPTVLHFSEDGVETLDSTTGGATVSNDAANDQNVDDQKDGAGDAGSGATAAAGTTEIIGTSGTTETTGTAVQFEASSFSIYGLVYTTITTTILTASGETYEITVDYDEDAQIPEGSELRVREITADDEEYEALYQEATQRATEDAASQGIDVPVVTGARLFDIEIHAEVDNGEGGAEDVKIEPAAPVRVSIKLLNEQNASEGSDEEDDADVNSTENAEVADAKKAGHLSVVHFAKDGTELIAVEDQDGSPKGDSEKRADDENTTVFNFEARSFSVYSVMSVSSLDEYLIGGAKYALVSQRGPNIGSAEDDNESSVSNYALMDSMNGTSLSGKGVYLDATTNLVGGDVTEWGFEKSGNEYLIYTGSGSSKKYVRANGMNLELTSDQGQATAFTVAYDNGKVRFSANYAYITNTGNNPSQFVMGYYENDDTLFTLAELDPNYEEQAAKKVSAENWKAGDSVEGKWNENDSIIIYRRIEHENGSEELYILATDGSLIPAYDGGDSIYYHTMGKNVDWHITYTDSGYVVSSVVPNGSSDPIVYLSPSVSNNTWSSDSQVGLTMNGLGRVDTYGTKIQNWDQAEYAYAGLHVDATSETTLAQGIKPGSGDNDDTFLFAVSGTLLSEGTLHPVDTVNSTEKGITMKIFNYGGPTYNWTYRNAAMQAVMGDDMLSDWDNRKSHVTKTVENKLGTDGFPVSLSNRNSYKPLFTGGSEISYTGRELYDLTNTAYPAGSITVYEHAANNLFLQSYYDESQTFRYSSMENFAQFNTSGDDEGKFTVYRETATPNTSPTQNDHYYFYHGHFMPFNEIDPTIDISRIVDQYGSIADVDEGRSYENVYGLKGTPDYYVGMSMEAKFVQPEDGKLENGDPVVYRFTGDDDLLVYIDGLLVLDVGGIHEPLTGSINFETGVIEQPNYYDQGEGWKHTYTTLYKVFNTAYKNGDLSPEEWAKLKWKDVDGDGTPDTFADYTTHSFKMFYMERGAGASNLDLMFNLKVVKKDEFVVRKKLPEGVDSRFVNQEYKYQATFFDDTETDDPSTTVDERIKPLFPGATKHDGTSVCDSVTYKDLKNPVTGEPITKNVTVDTNGYFTLKAGEAAVFKMSSDNVEYSVDVKETMIDTELIKQIDINNDQSVTISPDTQTPANGNIAEAGFEQVSERGEVIYTNHPYTRNLNITKHLTDDSAPLEPGEMPVFEFRVYLEKTVDVTTGDPPTTQTVHRLEPYSYGPYYVTKEVNGVTHYYKLNGLNNAPVDQGTEPVICSTTGRSGSINSIPPEYTIVVPNLAIGTNFYVEERLDNLPAGYEFVNEVLTPTTYGPETLTNESLSSQDVINRILARDENDYQQFDPSTIGAIIKERDAESHVYNRKKSIDQPVEKSWSPSAPASGTEVTLALVRFKAPASSTYTPPTGKGAVRINHVAQYGNSETTASLPSEFVAKYTITNKTTGEVVVPETLSTGPFDLDAGTYTVTTRVIRSADPEGYAYTETHSEDVTVTTNTTSDVTLTSIYSKVTSGYIDIKHVAAGLNSTDLPDGFTATYSIKNAAGQYVHVDVPLGKYAVAPGSYTVEIDLTDPAAPEGYSHQSTTKTVQVTVDNVEGGDTEDAEFTSTYVQNGSIIINHTASGLPGGSTTLPSGFTATYTITGPTTIENAVVGQAYPVAPGNYTVTMRLTGAGASAPVGYSYVKTEPANVTVASGDTPTPANLVSEYIVTPEDGYIVVAEKFVDGSGTEISRPNGFSSGYNIFGPTSYQSVSAGDSKYVEPGVYTVSAIKWGDPSGDLAYMGTDDVEVTVVGGTNTVTVTHRFGNKGTLTIVPKSSGLPGNTTDLPDQFSARYQATNKSTGEVIYIGQDKVGSPQSVAPGTYTVGLAEVYYEGNNIPKYYSRTDTPAIEVTVPSGGNANAEVISEYTYTAPETKHYTITGTWKDSQGNNLDSGPDTGSITIKIYGNNTNSVVGQFVLNHDNNWTGSIDLPVGEGHEGYYKLYSYNNEVLSWDGDVKSVALDCDSGSNDTESRSDAVDGQFTYTAVAKSNTAEVYLYVGYSVYNGDYSGPPNINVARGSSVTLKYSSSATINPGWELYGWNGNSWDLKDYGSGNGSQGVNINIDDIDRYCVYINTDPNDASSLGATLTIPQAINTVLPSARVSKHAFRAVASGAVVLNQSLSSNFQRNDTTTTAPVGASLKEKSDILLVATSSEEGDPSGGNGGAGGNGGSGSSSSTSNITDINPMTVTIPEAITNGLPANKNYTLDVSFGKSIKLDGTETPDAWKQLVSHLAEYDIYGTPYYYAIVETSVPEGYTVSYSNNNPVSAVDIRTNMDARAAAQAAEETLPALVTLSAINTRDVVPGSLTVQKKVEGLSDTTSEFTFEITLPSSADGTYSAVKTKADNTTEDVSVTFSGGKATVSLKANEKIEITNLPDGITYSVTEAGTLPTGYIQGTHDNTSGTIAQTTTVTMNNIYTVSLDIVKEDVTNSSKKIPGAQFTIRPIKDTLGGNGVEYNGAESDPITTDGNGAAQFTGIRKGYYEVHESKIPDGYVATTDDRFYIFVDEGIVKLLVKNLEESELKNWTSTQTTVGNVSLTANTATVTNEPGVELPNSGGPGTRLIYILGGMMTIAAGLLLLHGRKRMGT